MDHAGKVRHGFADLIDLASARLGGRALADSDDFFAEKENLLKPEPAVFILGRFTDRGKWMDGWESRRKRGPGHDWCVIALGRPGCIEGVNVDTSHFSGNQPESCSVEAAEFPPGSADDDAAPQGSGGPWTTIVDPTPLDPSREHLLATDSTCRGRRFTHVRLNIFPDGGVARFRVFGRVLPDWESLARRPEPIDLASAANGGLVVACNDMHFGSRHNLIMPDRALNMGDGWETRRKRGLKGGEHDWAIVRLGRRGLVAQVEVDTSHFKGNFPESCQVEACDAGPAADPIDPDRQEWRVVLPRTALRADDVRRFAQELDRGAIAQPCTHIRLKIYPDGGVSRLRVIGKPLL